MYIVPVRTPWDSKNVALNFLGGIETCSVRDEGVWPLRSTEKSTRTTALCKQWCRVLVLHLHKWWTHV